MGEWDVEGLDEGEYSIHATVTLNKIKYRTRRSTLGMNGIKGTKPHTVLNCLLIDNKGNGYRTT